jgi:hypothetical protein
MLRSVRFSAVSLENRIDTDLFSKPTIIGDGVREVMSQLAPVFWIQSPVLLVRVAIQSARNAGWRNRVTAAAGVVGTPSSHDHMSLV